MLFILLTSCSDGFKSKIFAIGKSHRITCYSGGQVVMDTYSTGKIDNEDKSDGYYFREKETGLLIRTNGDCIIRVKHE